MFHLTLGCPQTRVSTTFIGVPGWAANLKNYFSLVRPPVANNSNLALVATDWLCSLEEHCFLHSQALVSHSSVKLILFLAINCTGVRTAPASNQKMSKESSPASQSKLIPASEVKETITLVSHPIGLTELTASLEVLTTEVDKRSTVVHHTQTSSSSGANKIPRHKGSEEDFACPNSSAKEVCPRDVARSRGRSRTICPPRG